MTVTIALRMILASLRLAQNHIEICILCTATGTFRNNLTTLNVQLLHIIDNLENMTK